MDPFVEHADFIAEVLALAKDGPLLAPVAPLTDSSWHVVRSMAEAEDYAYSRLLDGRRLGDGDDDEELHSVLTLTWTDLREHEAGALLGVTYQDSSKAGLRQRCAELEDRMFPWLSRLHEAPLDDIVADLGNAVMSRCVFGRDDTRLFERVFRAYRVGGWPCGWRGRHPDGLLVVYEPPIAARVPITGGAAR